MVGMLSKNSPLYYWKENFKKFSKFYEDDLPNPLALEAEMQLWDKYWLNYKGFRPDSIEDFHYRTLSMITNCRFHGCDTVNRRNIFILQV